MTLELITVALVATMLILQIAVFFTMQKESKETNERIDQIEDLTSDKADETRVDGISSSIGEMSVNLDQVEKKYVKANDEIKAILERLDAIAEDIGRLDAMDFSGQLSSLKENVKQIEHDEKEIRAYYVNFRDPVEHNAGVPWAAAYPTYEEELEENVS